MAQKKTERTNMKSEKFTQKALKSGKSSADTVKKTNVPKSSFDYDDDDTMLSRLNPINKMTEKDKFLWKDFLKFILPAVYALVAIILICIVKSIVLAPSEKEIADQNTQIKRLHESYDLLSNEVNGGVIDKQKTEVFESQIYNGGVDVNEDVINSFFETYLNWQSGNQYEQLRQDIKNYLLTADGQPVYNDHSSFVICFLPPQDETYDEDRHRIYEVDAENTKLQYQGMWLYKNENSADSASYSAIVGIHVTSAITGPTGVDRRIYVTFTLKNGKLHNLQASPLYSSF